MGITNQGWYDRNEGRAYPVDEAASGLDDAGLRLPPDVIADLSLRWPLTLGRHAFLGAVSVTPALVTVTFQAAEAEAGDPGFTPLAVVTVRRPVEAGRVYALAAQADGVGGWVVFGRGAEDRGDYRGGYRGRFSSPAQSRLTARAARAYRPPAVTGVQVADAAAALSGVVLLKAVPPLALAKEEREIAGVLRDCVVLRLVDGAGAEGFPVPAAAAAISGFKEDNSFHQFAGPCAGRPESGSCGDPQPIEFVNSVAPDCDGVLTIEFTGCATAARVLDPCGAVIDCGLGLADACLPGHLPGSDGRLPNEYDPVETEAPEPDPEVPAEPGDSESLVTTGVLPHADCFTGGTATDFVVRSGLWTFHADDSPESACGDESAASASDSSSLAGASSYATNTAATRNVSLWEGFDTQATFRRVTTDVKLLAGPAGAKHNAGIVLNHAPHASYPGQVVYHLAELDFDTQELRVALFNGTLFFAVVPVTVPGIQLDRWYRLSVLVQPWSTPGQTMLTVSLRDVLDPGLVNALFSVVTGDYAPSTGRIGLGTNRALARFAYFKVEEVP